MEQDILPDTKIQDTDLQLNSYHLMATFKEGRGEGIHLLPPPATFSVCISVYDC